MHQRHYKFTWDFIGDIDMGRPHLGQEVPVEIYRLFQYTLRDVLEESVDTEQADLFLYKAGYIGGMAFFQRYIAPCTSFDDFLAKSKAALAEKKMGILRVESSNNTNTNVTLTISEDLDCSGLPETSHGVCNYDEGFLAGIFEAYTHKPFQAKETDCWCTGERVCRFEISARPPLKQGRK